MNDDGNEIDPLPTVMQGAIQVHELFASYVAAGFTEDQAMQLVIAMMHIGMNTMNGGTQ